MKEKNDANLIGQVGWGGWDGLAGGLVGQLGVLGWRRSLACRSLAGHALMMTRDGATGAKQAASQGEPGAASAAAVRRAPARRPSPAVWRGLLFRLPGGRPRHRAGVFCL